MALTRANLLLGISASAAALAVAAARVAAEGDATVHYAVHYTDAEWRQRLSPAAYDVLRQAGTEPAFSSALDRESRPGVYACAGCALALFDARTKFDSGTGWPSFYRPLGGAIATTADSSLMMARTEVHCRRCGGHLGHVFDDGPPPTGLRYCMNGIALTFRAAAKA